MVEQTNQKFIPYNQTGTETGDRWDEPLPTFQDGAININFSNNIIGYTSGDLVNGSIDVVLL